MIDDENRNIPDRSVSLCFYLSILFQYDKQDSYMFNYFKNLFSPQKYRNARVIDKRQQEYIVTTSYGGSNTTFYYITFEFDDGSYKELSVKLRTYRLLTEGDGGILKLQGNWFRKFVPNMN